MGEVCVCVYVRARLGVSANKQSSSLKHIEMIALAKMLVKYT